MSCYVHFRTRLASIMEVLAEAAVAEINELMDDGYAVLRLEISRKQKENDALKKKLHMMEMRIARCFGQDTRAREGSVGTCCHGVQISSELTSTGTSGGDAFPTTDGIFGEQSSFSLWGDGETTSVNEDQFVRRDQSAGIEEEPGSLLVKEETIEEDLQRSDSQRGLIISEERPVQSDGGERAPSVGTHTDTAVGTEELCEQHSTRHSVWEGSSLDTVRKAETNETVKLQATVGRLPRSGEELVLCERPGQMETFLSQNVIESENGGPACSYAARADLDSLSACSHQRLSPTTAKDAEKSLSSFRSCDEINSMHFEVEAGACSSWDKETQLSLVYTQGRLKKDSGTEKLLPEDVAKKFPTRAQIVPRDNTVGLKAKGSARRAPSYKTCATLEGMKTLNGTGTRGKQFICNFCGKSFSSPQNLQTHLRVHTGERPFSCAQCGKRFTQSGHLKTHQSVHTGERPHVCAHCGKKFAGKQNLRLHQQRNHQADYNAR